MLEDSKGSFHSQQIVLPKFSLVDRNLEDWGAVLAAPPKATEVEVDLPKTLHSLSHLFTPNDPS
jgi:hypothetical protein